MENKTGLDDNNLPNQEAVYLAKKFWENGEHIEIDVYEYLTKGLCCFSEDFGSPGTGVNDETDCHVAVQCTGLEFLMRLRD